MKEEFRGLTLNHKFFARHDLVDFCQNRISENKIPGWELEVYRFILNFLDNSDFISQQTSGSTGTPKTIRLSKQAMCESAKMTLDFFQLKSGDVAILCLPIKYIAGKMMIVRSFQAGLNLILTEPTGTPDFSKIENIDFCALVPLQATNLLEQNKWPEINTLILGGTETGVELTEKLQKVKTKVFETYGMAETSSHIGLRRINGKNNEPYFTTLPGIKISVDERDCLVINAPFLKNKIVTNDVIEQISENKFRWIGRSDNVINSGGIKIQPEILEKQMEEILKLPCAVLAVPNKLLGQETVLVIETKLSLGANQILTKLAPFFDRRMLPKKVRCISSFPRNSSFKTDRAALEKLI